MCARESLAHARRNLKLAIEDQCPPATIARLQQIVDEVEATLARSRIAGQSMTVSEIIAEAESCDE
jgi:hypothetical protein